MVDTAAQTAEEVPIAAVKVAITYADGSGSVYRLDGEQVAIAAEAAQQTDEVATSRLVLPSGQGVVVEKQFAITLTARTKRDADGRPVGDDGRPLVRVEHYPTMGDAEGSLRALGAFLVEHFPDVVQAHPRGTMPTDIAAAILTAVASTGVELVPAGNEPGT